MGSTITAATADLFDRLAALAVDAGPLSGTPTVQVTFGPPNAVEEQQVVSLMGVIDNSEDHAALGAQRRDERYDIELGVKVHNPVEDSAEAVFARSRVLVDAIAAAVHGSTAGRTLGGAVINAQMTNSRTDGILPAEGGGWVVFWRVLISCHGRFTV